MKRKNASNIYPMKEVAHNYYDTMFQLTRTCLSTLARGIKVDEEKFLSLLDTEESRANKDYQSSTIFRYFHYKNKKSCDEEPCKTHTDIGKSPPSFPCMFESNYC